MLFRFNMKTHIGVSLTLSNHNYESLVKNLERCNNKFEILSLKINGSHLNIIRRHLLNGFTNVTDLNLSNCHINSFDDGTFNQLINLKSIDLSNNDIKVMNENLFYMNGQLEVIIFKNNLLNTIINTAYTILGNLKTLDLSYNQITRLNEHFLNCPNLRVLYLNNNYIDYMGPVAYGCLPNLVYLGLQNNKIKHLKREFDNLIHLRHLDLSYNLISFIYYRCFWNLEKLNCLYINNNLLTTSVSFDTFNHNHKLSSVDLSENNICSIRRGTFKQCYNLKILKLTVINNFEVSCVKCLHLLTEFELFYKTKSGIDLLPRFWKTFDYKNRLSVLKLIFQKLNSFALCNFRRFTNLEIFHFECTETNDKPHVIKFAPNFNRLPKLESLTLKKLNHFTAIECDFDENKLKYLNLSGIKNVTFGNVFSNCLHLEYLDLSFSEITYITEDSFKNLVNLEHLELGYSKLKSIQSTSFKNNTKLEILNCSNCCIETIDKYSFSNLINLKLLDLSNNFLLNISENFLCGLNTDTCIILL